MANKSDFTTEEWGLLVSSPMIAGIAITAADPSGVWGLIKEGMSAGWALVEVRKDAQANPLVKAVAEDFATAEGRMAARSALQTRFHGAKLEAIKDAALSALRSVSEMLRTKAPGDAAAFRTWLQDVARQAAEAGSEGGFLGFGGVAVSEAEKATLADISLALNETQIA
jgi:hypothetical protein